jgi:hypothetical protein
MGTDLSERLARPLGEQPEVEEWSTVADTFAGRVHIEWDTAAPVTPLGQLPFFIEYLKVVTKRQSPMSSLRARATIIVLRVLARPSAGASLIPQCQGAALLKPQKAPGELDHPTADPGIAGFGKPLFPPPGAALVRRTRQAGVAPLPCGHASAG